MDEWATFCAPRRRRQLYLMRLWTNIHLWRIWRIWHHLWRIWWILLISLPSLSPFSTSPWPFPIRIWKKFCQVQRSFFGNGRLVGVASRTSTGLSSEIGSIRGIIKSDGFPCFNFSKSAQSVGRTIWEWHDLLDGYCLSAMCLYIPAYAYLTVGRAVMISKTKWP